MSAATPLDSRAVSVVIPHYGDPVHAQNLIAALRAQRGGDELEIIVSDDCSPQSYPAQAGVIVRRREHNGGFGSAVNSGAGLATRPYILVLNSDLSLPPDFVTELLRQAAPWQPAVVAPALVSDTGEPQWSGRHFPRTHHYVAEWLRPLARWRSKRALHEAVGHDTRCLPGATVLTDWLVGAALLLPTELFRSAGGFDERFYMYCEETDLQRKLRDRGIPSVYLGDVVLQHAGGASTDSARRLGWLFTSRFLYARLWRKGATRLHAALVVAALINTAFAGLRRLAGRPEHPLKLLRTELRVLNESAREGKQRATQPRAVLP